jgi:hypothetical protein
MSHRPLRPITSGRAFRISIIGPQQTEAYEDVFVSVDPTNGMAHVFDAERLHHFLSIPTVCALIEWRDPSALQPKIRVQPLAEGAFAKYGEQMQRMVKEMTQGLETE